jgi:hypothetical protein
MGTDPATDADAEADGELVALGEAVGLIVTFPIGSSCFARDFFGANVCGFTFGCCSPSSAETGGEAVALVLDEVAGELLGETDTDGVDLAGGVIFRCDVPDVAAGVDDTAGDGDDEAKGLAVLIGLKAGNVDSFDLSLTVCSGVDVGVTDAVCAAGVAEAEGS